MVEHVARAGVGRPRVRLRLAPQVRQVDSAVLVALGKVKLVGVVKHVGGEDDEPVVYCVMDKIVHCNWKVPMEIGVIKHSFPGVRRQLKEFVKIGVFRGIFRCSDFNCRNVLVGCDNGYSQQYFVSIDEGDIGKRLDILGGREKWLIEALNKDKSIINEIKDECFGTVGKIGLVIQKMKEHKFSDELCDEVLNNWNNLRKDLESEGVLFV